MRLFIALLLMLGLAAAADAAVVTFDTGLEGWAGPAAGFGGIGTTLPTSGGNPGANARIQFNDFGISFSNNSSADFNGDLRGRGLLTLGADIKVDDISFAGSPEERDLIVELRSHALAQNGFPWTSVYVKLASLNSGSGWTRHAVTFDPAAATLPADWGGYGAEDPQTGAPMLPTGVSFSDVMASVDEVAFTTLVPGYFFNPDDFDVSFDNLSIGAAVAPAPVVQIPTLGTLATVLLGLLLGGGAVVRQLRVARLRRYV